MSFSENNEDRCLFYDLGIKRLRYHDGEEGAGPGRGRGKYTLTLFKIIMYRVVSIKYLFFAIFGSHILDTNPFYTVLEFAV